MDIPTQDELIAIVRSYYSPGLRMDDPANLATPETERLTRVWKEALNHDAQWQELYRALRGAFPGDMMGELTVPFLGGARRLAVYVNLPSNSARKLSRKVIGCVSLLAPLYYIYGAQHVFEDGRRIEPHLFLDRIPEEMVPYAMTMAQHIESVFHYRPFPAGFAGVAVPDICVGDLDFGEVTLRDALFTSDPALIP